MSSDTRTEILARLAEKMADMFEVEESSIRPDTHLFEDLDLDSIDAIDLAVHLQEYTGKKVDEGSLRDLKTVDDVVELILTLRAP
jgi:acyl carrier protein